MENNRSPKTGLEPITERLTVACSTIELLGTHEKVPVNVQKWN